MSQFGTCDTGCSERKLELVRAPAYDALLAAASNASARANAFAELAQRVARDQPDAGEVQNAYRSAQRCACDLLRRHPDIDEP